MRNVVIHLEIDYPVSVPDDWGEENVNFWIKGSSHCRDNFFVEIAERSEALVDPETGCGRDCYTCRKSTGWYVREATEDDMMCESQDEQERA